MLGKKTIISCLLPAYVLLVLHAIIPHHHHYESGSDPIIFHHDFDFVKGDPMNHHDDHGTDCCAKAHHFAHSPEKGEAMIKPGIKRIAFPYAKTTPCFLIDLTSPDINIVSAGYRLETEFCNQLISTNYISAHTLRGPPECLHIG